jgi:hypothetical protein
MKNPIVINDPQVAIVLTPEQAKEIGLETSEDQQRGEFKTVNNWCNTPISFKTICMSAKYTTEGYTKCYEKTIYGIRTLTNIRSSGYEIEGYVSIKGKKYSAFSSSQMFEVEGKLIDAQIIHARVN